MRWPVSVQHYSTLPCLETKVENADWELGDGRLALPLGGPSRLWRSGLRSEPQPSRSHSVRVVEVVGAASRDALSAQAGEAEGPGWRGCRLGDVGMLRGEQ